MMDRTQLLVSIILAKALVASHPFDHRGTFVLLASMDEVIDPSLSCIMSKALQANMLAALTGDEQASERARQALAHVIADLESRRATL